MHKHLFGVLFLLYVKVKDHVLKHRNVDLKEGSRDMFDPTTVKYEIVR